MKRTKRLRQVLCCFLMIVCAVVSLPVTAEDAEPSAPPLTLWQLAESKKPLFDLGNDTAMGYVMKTDSGEIVVIDGGNAEDAEDLWALLSEIGGARPRIAAWFLTHPHSDHYMAFTALCEEHADEFDLDLLCYGFPSFEALGTYENGAPTRAGALYHRFAAIEPLFQPIHEIPEKGKVWTFGGLTVEAVFVPGERYAFTRDLNSTSIILRAEAAGQSILFLADQTIAADLYDEVPPEKLKADVCQMAHHGNSAVGKTIYHLIMPRVCLWPTQGWLWDNNERGKGFDTGTWTTVMTRRWMADLGVTRHIVSKDGLEKLEFPLDFSDRSWGNQPAAPPVTVTVEPVWAAQGEKVAVPVTLSHTPGLIGACFAVEAPPGLTLVGYYDGGLLGECFHPADLSRSPYPLTWGDDLAREDHFENGVLITLIYEVAEDLAPGDYTIRCLPLHEQDAFIDNALTSCCYRLVDGTVTITCFRRGDVNRDGAVTQLDRLLLSRYLAEWHGEYDDIDLRNADSNGDGEVTQLDRVILSRYVAEFGEEYDRYFLPIKENSVMEG